MATADAVRKARDEGFDLVEIAPNASPPVCKIIDIGKYKYELAKKAKEAKKKQHVIKLKEIKLRPKTDEHDYAYKMEHAIEFLKKGDRVKVTVVFRGREMAHQEFGYQILTRAKKDLSDYSNVEVDGQMDGKRLTSVFLPAPNKQKQAPKEKSSAPAAAAPVPPNPVTAKNPLVTNTIQEGI